MNDRKAILDAVRRIVRAVRLSSSATEQRLGLSAAQLFVMEKLSERQPLSVTELAREALTHQSSVSVVASKLVARGLVRRHPSRRDRRRIDLSLTRRGRSILAGAPEAVQTRLIRALDGLPATERRKLSSLLDRWTKAAGITESAPPLFGEESKEGK